MSDASIEPAVFVPRGHPDRRLVAAITLIGVVCVALWWFGAAGPRLTAVVRTVDADTAGGRGTLLIEVRNDGRLPVDLRGIEVDDRGGPPLRVGDVRINGRRDGAIRARLESGEVARLDLSYSVDCNRPTGYGSDPVLAVRVKAPLGITRGLPAGTSDLYRARTGGDESVDPGPLLCPFATPLRGGGAPLAPR